MIRSNQEYQEALRAIDELLAKHKEGESADADAELLRLAKEVEEYETTLNLDIAKPLTLSDLVLAAMSDRNLTLTDLAAQSEIDANALQAMIEGKMPFTLDVVKRLYVLLNLEAREILESADASQPNEARGTQVNTGTAA